MRSSMPPVPLGIRREVVAAGRLLRRAEAAMVGGRGLQLARDQPRPQRLLMMLRAERRAHDIGGRRGPVLVAIDALVDQQMLRQHLAVDALTGGAGAGDGVRGLGGRHVHDIDRRAQQAGDGDDAVGGLAFHIGRP